MITFDTHAAVHEPFDEPMRATPPPEPDGAAMTWYEAMESLRSSLHMSRQEFVTHLCIPSATYRSWKAHPSRLPKVHLRHEIERALHLRFHFDDRDRIVGWSVYTSRKRAAVRPVHTGPASAWLPVLDAMLDELMGQSDLSVDLVAVHLQMQPATIAALVLECTGRTFRQHLMLRRLHRARALLEADMLSVTEVARSCGFRHVTYFSRVFAREFALAPKRLQMRVRHGRADQVTNIIPITKR
jgi:AraC-like DNA-binding protein